MFRDFFVIYKESGYLLSLSLFSWFHKDKKNILFLLCKIKQIIITFPDPDACQRQNFQIPYSVWQIKIILNF